MAMRLRLIELQTRPRQQQNRLASVTTAWESKACIDRDLNHDTQHGAASKKCVFALQTGLHVDCRELCRHSGAEVLDLKVQLPIINLPPSFDALVNASWPKLWALKLDGRP
eukprot:1036027-Amphidinium_carterae.1